MENKTWSSMRILAWAFCIFLLLSLRLSFAQESVVQGIVTDEQGKAVKNGRLTLLDQTPGSGWPGYLAGDSPIAQAVFIPGFDLD